MKQHWTKIELDSQWCLSKEELLCINNKAKLHRLSYAMKMKFFIIHGYFLESCNNIASDVIHFLASQIKSAVILLERYNWQSRSSQLHNEEIRQFYGYKKFNNSNWGSIEIYLQSNCFVQGDSTIQVQQTIYDYLRDRKIEPPAKSMIIRKISNLFTKFENKFFDNCADHITIKGKKGIKRIISSNREPIILSVLRRNTGKLSQNTISEELKKLGYLEETSVLYNSFFSEIPKKLLQKYHDKVSLMTPSALNNLYKKSANKFFAILACFVKYKGTRTIDNLAEIFIRRYHRSHQRAKLSAKTEIFDYYTKSDKEKLLNNLVDISLKYPKESIEDKIYTGIGGKEVLESSKASRSSFRHAYKGLEYKYMSSLYVHHHRKYILAILNSIKITTNSDAPKLAAIQYILDNSQNKDYDVAEFLKNNSNQVGIQSADLKVIKEQSTTKERNTYYEIAILSSFKKNLRCKNIWVKGAFKYSDPDEDMPKDFNQRRKYYCNMLGVSDNFHSVELELKKDMKTWMHNLNDTLPQNLNVRIGKKGKAKKPHIYLTPYESQDEPSHLKELKTEIAMTWPSLGLLDILKEADLRVGLTSELVDLYGKTSLDTMNLRQRLIMCLFAMGTNTEFNKVCSGASGISAEDLRYTKKRVLSPEVLRHIIRKLVNSTLEIRDSAIWGELTNSFASDSTKFASWSDNLMTEYHIRYQGNGIMAYWHIERKALCISSQTIRCSDSEVAAMLRGIIHHATNAKVEKHSTDTHGQSLVAFAFAYILGIDLRPRIKGIGKIKLYKADSHIAKYSYDNIQSVMTRSIRWDHIHPEYDNILKCTVALKSQAADPEILLKRFISDNLQSPLYKAILELGRAARTIYICKYLISEELRIEVEEALNVIENWHSGNHFIFFGKRGVVSSNNPVDQELSILALHLLQSSLVYINTLMIQQVLKKPIWSNKLTIEDKRALTPLFYNHINQYGLYSLDMNKRINIEGL